MNMLARFSVRQKPRLPKEARLLFIHLRYSTVTVRILDFRV